MWLCHTISCCSKNGYDISSFGFRAFTAYTGAENELFVDEKADGVMGIYHMIFVYFLLVFAFRCLPIFHPSGLFSLLFS